MADTDFDTDYTDVSPVAGTDKLLIKRGAGGANVLASEFLTKNASGDFNATSFASPNVGTTGAVRLRDASGNPNACYLQFLNYNLTVEYGWIRALAAGGFSFSGGINAVGQGTFVSPGSGTTGGLQIKDAGGNPNAAILQFINNGGTAQYGYIKGNSSGTIDFSGSPIPISDNGIALGAAAKRWSVVYAGTGTINTSDAREKDWKGGLSNAEMSAARRIIDELGWFQWTAEAARKGEDAARRHFGARAQAVIRILMEEGVEAAQPIDFPADVFVPASSRPSFRSAFLCFDTWEDDYVDEVETVREAHEVPSAALDDRGSAKKATVTRMIEKSVPTGRRILQRAAGNIFSLRVDQLTLFLLAAQGQRQRAIEERLRAIEAQQ